MTSVLGALLIALPLSTAVSGTAFADRSGGGGEGGRSASSEHAKSGNGHAPSSSSSSSEGHGKPNGTAKKADAGHQTAPAPAPVVAAAAEGPKAPAASLSQPQPYSNADKTNKGANSTSASNPYRSTRDGSPSLNGNGKGEATGKPCAGCVGKADNKNPPGQAPGGSDHNKGYECDANHGIGRSNPAHTGCKSTTPPPPPPSCQGSSCQPPHDCDDHDSDDHCTPPPVCVPSAGNQCGTTPPQGGCIPTATDTCGQKPPGCTSNCGNNPPPACTSNCGNNPPPVCIGSLCGGSNGGEGTIPVSNPVPGQVPGPVSVTQPGTLLQPTPTAPTLSGATAQAGSLPFTGTDAVLLVELAGLLLAVGGVLAVVARRERRARAR